MPCRKCPKYFLYINDVLLNCAQARVQHNMFALCVCGAPLLYAIQLYIYQSCGQRNALINSVYVHCERYDLVCPDMLSSYIHFFGFKKRTLAVLCLMQCNRTSCGALFFVSPPASDLHTISLYVFSARIFMHNINRVINGCVNMF